MLANRRYYRVIQDSEVQKRDNDGRFHSGRRNKADSRMRIKICNITLIYGRIAVLFAVNGPTVVT